MHKLQSNALFRELKYSKHIVVVTNISKHEGDTSNFNFIHDAARLGGPFIGSISSGAQHSKGVLAFVYLGLLRDRKSVV